MNDEQNRPSVEPEQVAAAVAVHQTIVKSLTDHEDAESYEADTDFILDALAEAGFHVTEVITDVYELTPEQCEHGRLRVAVFRCQNCGELLKNDDGALEAGWQLERRAGKS